MNVQKKLTLGEGKEERKVTTNFASLSSRRQNPSLSSLAAEIFRHRYKRSLSFSPFFILFTLLHFVFLDSVPRLLRQSCLSLLSSINISNNCLCSCSYALLENRCLVLRDAAVSVHTSMTSASNKMRQTESDSSINFEVCDEESKRGSSLFIRTQLTRQRTGTDLNEIVYARGLSDWSQHPTTKAIFTTFLLLHC